MHLGGKTKRALIYGTALCIGGALGWTMSGYRLQSSSDIAPSSDLSGTNVVVTAMTDERTQTVLDVNPSTVEPGVIEETSGQSQADNDIVLEQFLSKIAAMNVDEFERATEDRHVREKWLSNPQMLENLFNQVMQIEDKTLRYRAKRIIGMASMADIRYEDWAIDSIRNYDNASEWLSHLATWPVRRKENVQFLVDRIDHFPEISQKANALKIVAMNHYQIWDEAERTALVRLFEPFLRAEEPAIRAAAVSSLRGLPFDDSEDIVTAALSDDSSDVRSAAIHVLGNHQYKSPEVQAILLRMMQDKTRPVLERLEAYSILSIFPLAGDDYETYHSFVLADRQTLIQQYREQLQRQRALGTYEQ